VTRLKPNDLASLGQGLDLYERELQAKTGRTLRQIACRAAGIDEEQILKGIRNTTVGVVSMTVGKGILHGFAEAVRDIIHHLGYKAFVPRLADVVGLAGAIEQGADVIFMADDARFVAVNLSTRRVVDNAEATGRGYGVALEGLADGMLDRTVLVIGAGKVGTSAARILREMGTQIGVFDWKRPRAQRLAREVKGVVEGDLERALDIYTILVDASPASGIIEARHIKPTTMVAAPGVPLGLTPEAQYRIRGRLIHDPLQIGVATMMISVLC
jgi:pyrrolysine biosynthesis protein PylD